MQLNYTAVFHFLQKAVGFINLIFVGKAQHKHYLWATVIALVYWAFVLWAPGYYYIDSKQHLPTDWMFPATAAVAFESTLSLHSEYFSPWGGGYFLHSYIAHAITQLLLANPSPFDVYFTMGVIALLFLYSVMITLSHFVRIVFPLWLVVIFLLVHLTAAIVHHDEIHWFENYNEFLSCLCVIFIVACLWLSKNLNIATPARLKAFGLIFGVMICFALLYKINFSIALMALFGATGIRIATVYHRHRTPLLHYSLAGLGGAVALALAVAIVGYDLTSYADNVRLALNAKAQGTSAVVNLTWLPGYLLLFPLLCWWLCRVVEQNKQTNKQALSELIVWAGVWMASLFCFLGTATWQPFQSFFQYTLLLTMAWLLKDAMPRWIQKDKHIRFFQLTLQTFCAVVFIVVLALPSLTIAAHQLAVKTHPAVAKASGYIIYADFAFTTPPSNRKRYLINIKQPGDQTKELPNHAVFAYGTKEAIEIFKQQKALNGGVPPKVAMMTFTDDLLYYEPSSIMKYKIHDKHIGVAIPKDNIIHLIKEVDNADMVFIPKIINNIDSGAGYFGCWFLLYSPEAKKFKYTQQTEYWHVFVRQSGSYFRPQWTKVLQERWFVNQCNQLIRYTPSFYPHNWMMPYVINTSEWLKRFMEHLAEDSNG